MSEQNTNQTPDGGKTFTQEQVNQIVTDRLARERARIDAEYAEKERFERINKDTDGLVSALLKTPDKAGRRMLDQAIPLAVKYYDRSIVKRGEDGSILNAKEVVDSFRAEWDAFFGTITTVGSNVGNPPPYTPRPNEDAAIRKAMGLQK